MLRTLHKSDLEDILAIEKAVHVLPWTEETFNTCFQSGYIGWVVEEGNKIVGFIIISLIQSECHVLNLCVLQDYQHQGFGSKLLTCALHHAKEQGMIIAYLEVRRSNLRAISLYQKMQFHLIGERKGYYPSGLGYEDALVFAKTLHDPPNI